MDYEFRNIESLIRNAISFSGKSKKSLNEQFAATRRAVAEEKAKARNSLAIQAATLGCKDQITLYIRYHQHSVASFIDELYSLRDGKNPRLSSEVFFFNDQLNDLLKFIQYEARIVRPNCYQMIRQIAPLFERSTLSRITLRRSFNYPSIGKYNYKSTIR